jgi:NAD(P)H-quinone oxidoreductase subunit 5
MEPILPEMPMWRTAALWAVPAAYLLAAALGSLPAASSTRSWRWARVGCAVALAAALVSLAWLMVAGAASSPGHTLWSLGEAGALQTGLRSDVPALAMLLLVCFIGWVITTFSQPYLHGERGVARYQRGLMLTLASVSLLVTSNNLLLLALAWIATSLSLHGLLTFFGQRPQALIAAHKKFLASRVADVCLLAAVALVGGTLGTLEIDRASAAVQALPVLPPALQVAAVLFVLSALLKCAQLPVHGWLIQVMEAPTPVSALLHAGIVNLGGFLLIRLGSLVSEVPAAMALLVVVGSLTAVVASMVMMTRISIKVALAWSTCAQMGFMLMQCGLGLHALALLHLLAHSLYKAHAFLAAGGAVEQQRLRRQLPPAPVGGIGAWWGGAAGGAAAVATAAWLFGVQPSQQPALWAATGILALALAPLVGVPLRHAGLQGPLAGLAAAWAVALVWFALHLLAERALGAAPIVTSPWLIGWVLALFALLFVVQGVVRARPRGVLARGLYPWLFAGLYLDELFTRLTFLVWPARAAVPVQPRRPDAVPLSVVPQDLP